MKIQPDQKMRITRVGHNQYAYHRDEGICTRLILDSHTVKIAELESKLAELGKGKKKRKRK